MHLQPHEFWDAWLPSNRKPEARLTFGCLDNQCNYGHTNFGTHGCLPTGSQKPDSLPTILNWQDDKNEVVDGFGGGCEDVMFV